MIGTQGQRYASAVHGRRRRPRLAAATLVVAALAASCGSGGESNSDAAADRDDVTTEQATGTTDATALSDAPAAPGMWDGALDLGSLEAGGGLGSAATAGAAAIAEPVALGNDWQVISEAVEAPVECFFGQPKAAVRRAYLNFGTGESVGIGLDVFASTAEAEAALEEILGAGYKPCLEAAFEAFQGKVAEQGVYDSVEAELVGDLEPSLLGTPDGGTHRYVLQANGPTSSLTLDSTVTHYVSGQAVVSIEAALLSDRHELITGAAASMVADDLSWEPDPAVDAAIDRLRLAVLGPDSPDRFYPQFAPAMVIEPTDTRCEGPAAGIAELDGPLWATNQGISAVFQTASSYPDEATAETALATLAESDPACVSGIIAELVAGTATYDDGTIAAETVDGREMVIADISMTQFLDGSTVPVDVAGITVFVRVGTDVLAWNFIGIRGDEPSMTELAARSAEQLEAGTP